MNEKMKKEKRIQSLQEAWRFQLDESKKIFLTYLYSSRYARVDFLITYPYGVYVLILSVFPASFQKKGKGHKSL